MSTSILGILQTKCSLLLDHSLCTNQHIFLIASVKSIFVDHLLDSLHTFTFRSPRSSGRIFQHCPVLSSVFYILHLHAISFQEIGDVAKPMLSHINKSFIKMKPSGLLWLVKCHLSHYGITCSLVNF